MPWRELSVVEQREEFVKLALVPGANKSELCRRFWHQPRQGPQVDQALSGGRARGAGGSLASAASQPGANGAGDGS